MSDSASYYLVTIKRVSPTGYTSREDIEAVYQSTVKKLRRAEWSDHVCWELDTLQRWHCHTVCVTHGHTYFKGLQTKGWTVNFTPFPEIALGKIIRYIYKCKQNKYELEEKDWQSRAKYEYLFI